MNNFFKHITSLFLALLVLVSTQSYSINLHYCGSILVEKSFVKPAKKCAMHQEIAPACGMHNNATQPREKQQKSCCDDEFEIIEGQDEIKLQESSIQLPSPTFVAAYIFAFHYVPSSVDNGKNSSEYHSPPPLFQRDVHAFFQVYLI